jgi:anti-sigma factor NepR-like protein
MDRAGKWRRWSSNDDRLCLVWAAEPSLRDPSLPTPTLDPISQGRIGRELRAMYAELERQPIPQRFLDLLDRLVEPKGTLQ